MIRHCNEAGRSGTYTKLPPYWGAPKFASDISKPFGFACRPLVGNLIFKALCSTTKRACAVNVKNKIPDTKYGHKRMMLNNALCPEAISQILCKTANGVAIYDLIHSAIHGSPKARHLHPSGAVGGKTRRDPGD